VWPNFDGITRKWVGFGRTESQKRSQTKDGKTT